MSAVRQPAWDARDLVLGRGVEEFLHTCAGSPDGLFAEMAKRVVVAMHTRVVDRERLGELTRAEVVDLLEGFVVHGVSLRTMPAHFDRIMTVFRPAERTAANQPSFRGRRLLDLDTAPA